MTHYPSAPRVGDLAKERDVRLVRFQSWLNGRDLDEVTTQQQRADIWTWIEQGGIAPWDVGREPTGAQPYPPVAPVEGRARRVAG